MSDHEGNAEEPIKGYPENNECNYNIIQICQAFGAVGALVTRLSGKEAEAAVQTYQAVEEQQEGNAIVAQHTYAAENVPEKLKKVLEECQEEYFRLNGHADTHIVNKKKEIVQKIEANVAQALPVVDHASNVLQSYLEHHMEIAAFGEGNDKLDTESLMQSAAFFKTINRQLKTLHAILHENSKGMLIIGDSKDAPGEGKEETAQYLGHYIGKGNLGNYTGEDLALYAYTINAFISHSKEWDKSLNNVLEAVGSPEKTEPLTSGLKRANNALMKDIGGEDTKKFAHFKAWAAKEGADVITPLCEALQQFECMQTEQGKTPEEIERIEAYATLKSLHTSITLLCDGLNHDKKR